MRLVINSPSTTFGGTSLLFTRVAAHWQEIAGTVPAIVDFEEGVPTTYLRERGIPFHKIPYRRGQTTTFDPSDTVLMSLLPARELGARVLPDPKSKLLLWSTHPQDAFKWIPSYRIARTWPESLQNRYSRIVHPRYYRRLAAAFADASRAGGLVAMDSACAKSISLQFQMLPPPTVPICTDDASIGRALKPSGTIRFCWVGRLEDFKTEPCLALIRAVSQTADAGFPVTLDIIGSGEDSAMVQSLAENVGRGRVRLLGAMRPEALDRHLAENVDVFLGHGASMLEAAKLGVPCAVIHGFYFSVRGEELKFTWLDELAEGDVGEIVHSRAELGVHAVSSLPALSTEYAQRGVGALERWQKVHTPRAVAKRVYDLAQRNELTYERFVAQGINDFDAFGALLMTAKRYLTRNKY